MKLRLLAIAALCVLVGCSDKQPTESQTAPTYNVTLNTQEIMRDLVEPASQLFWHSSGTDDTENGTKDLAPTTDAGWAAARNAMTTVAEAGNLLMLPGRTRDNDEWLKLSKQMTEAALVARAAVLAKDDKAMFDTGGKLYEVCSACHEKYLAPFLGPDGKPTKLLPDGKPNPIFHEASMPK